MKLFISSSDYYLLEKPVTVMSFEKKISNDRVTLEVEIEPELKYAMYGEEMDVRRLILFPRFTEDAFVLLDQFPIDVHVLLPKDKEYIDGELGRLSDMYRLAWATLYNDYEDALKNKIAVV